MKKTTRWSWLVLAVVFSTLSRGFAAEPESTTSGLVWAPLQSKTMQMGEDTIDFDGRKLPVQTFVLIHGSSSFNQAVALPLEGEVTDYTEISFRLRIERPSGAEEKFVVYFLNETPWFLQNGPKQAGTKFLAHANEVAPGEYVFTWRIDELLENFPMSDARFLALMYPVQSIPEGETIQISVSEVAFQK